MNKFDELACVLNRKSINISQAPWLSTCLGLLLAVPAPRLRAGTTPGSLTSPVFGWAGGSYYTP